MPGDKKVNSYRFLDGLSRRMIRSWSLEKPRDIPWTPLDKPLNRCTVALISSAGIALKTDKPFDQEIERQNPWFSDPSFRAVALFLYWLYSPHSFLKVYSRKLSLPVGVKGSHSAAGTATGQI